MHERITLVKPRADNAAVHSSGERDPRDIIRALIDKRGFNSPRALALAAGVSQPTLSRYLARETEDMEMPSWRALAAALQVTVSELLGETPLMGDSANAVRRHLQVMESLPEWKQKTVMDIAKTMAAEPPAAPPKPQS